MPRSHRSILSQKSLSHSGIRRQSDNATSLSQPSTSASTPRIVPMSRFSQKSHESSDLTTSDEENQLASSVIKYFLVLDKEKQTIYKKRLIKNVFDNQGKHFDRIMSKVKNILSQTFGYRLIELEGNKYILVNEIQNELPHICPMAIEGSQQVLLFIVLTHIFMHEESCPEESLWNFLTNLGIPCSDNDRHAYFGHVKHLITEVFITQKYLDKIVIETNDLLQVEFIWGPRAEYEFSRRSALEFVSQVYNGRPMNSWPLQFKISGVREKSVQSE